MLVQSLYHSPGGSVILVLFPLGWGNNMRTVTAIVGIKSLVMVAAPLPYIKETRTS